MYLRILSIITLIYAVTANDRNKRALVSNRLVNLCLRGKRSLSHFSYDSLFDKHLDTTEGNGVRSSLLRYLIGIEKFA